MKKIQNNKNHIDNNIGRSARTDKRTGNREKNQEEKRTQYREKSQYRDKTIAGDKVKSNRASSSKNTRKKVTSAKHANTKPDKKMVVSAKKIDVITDDMLCPYAKKCGGCDYQGLDYARQLAKKQDYMNKLMKLFGKVEPIVGMDNPYHY